MTIPRDPDSIVATWLEEGPTELPEATRRAIAVATRSARQNRRAISVPWRTNPMNALARLAISAAGIVLAAGGVIMLLSPGNQGVGGPTPAATSPRTTSNPTTSTPAASILPGPVGGLFSSPRYGFIVDRPAGIQVTPSEEDWSAGAVASPESKFLDRFNGKLESLSPVSAATYFAGIASQPLPQDMSAEDWMAGHIQRNLEAFGAACGGIASDWEQVTVAGAAGRRVKTDCGAGTGTVSEMVFAADGRGWIITGDTVLVDVLLKSFGLPG
jgi:hypothetical protein